MNNQEMFNLDALMTDLSLYVNEELQKCGKSHIEAGTVPHSETETCWIEADEKRLRQIFLILLDDAVKYVESGFILFGYMKSTVVITDDVTFFVDYTTCIDKTPDDLLNDDLPIASGLIAQMGSKMELNKTASVGSSISFDLNTSTNFTKN